MPDLIQISDDLTFALSNAHFAYVFRVSPEGILEHLHYGGPLSDPLSVPHYHVRMNRHVVPTFQGTPFYSLSDVPQEYPSSGTSDHRYPAVHARNADGNSVLSLLYVSHDIVDAKPSLDGLPSSRGGGSQTLIVTLQDAAHGLQVQLSYTLWADYGVLARSATFRNQGPQDIDLSQVCSTALDLPADDYEIQHFHGTWAREFNEERVSVPHARFVAESARGTSSAAHNPYVAIVQAGATEDYGRCYGTTLVYSGNFAISVEKGEFGGVRVLAGINPFDFNWRLEPGQSFTTPEALQAYSSSGLRTLSHHWHDFIRDKVSPERFRHVPRPTYLNTWEAAYFDVNEDKVLALADTAKRIGVDMLVLDDGWFEGRDDDTSSLGDWRADPVRFPNGIPALAAKVKAKGLKFGLWFEPEMVNSHSQLYAQYPDWILHVPTRTPSLGRNQLTLDLTRADVQDYLFGVMDAVLSCGDVDYIKWDMNRTMTEVGSAGLPRDRQAETAHRYMLGLYGLLDRLVTAYPDILFENCASGGNRFDLGMLSYMAQGWVSDMCDPVGRLGVVGGASHLFPLDAMAAYIGPSPNHQNGRVSSIRTRFLAGAFCAARGISLNDADIAAHENELRDWMAVAHDSKADVVGGRFDRLKRTDNDVVWQQTARGGETVYVSYFHILSAPNSPARRVYLVGLDPNAEYTLADSSAVYRGDALMQSGLPLPRVSVGEVAPDVALMPEGDFSAHLFVLRRI